MKVALRRIIIFIIVFSTPITLLLYLWFDYMVRNHTLSYEIKLYTMIIIILLSIAISVLILLSTLNRDKDEQIKLSSLITNLSDDAVLITDENNIIIHGNDKFLSLTGYTLDEIKGKKPNILKSGIQPQSYYDHMWEAVYEKGIFEGEIWDKKKSGEIYPKHIKIISVRNKFNKVKYHISIQTDLTTLKKLESEKEKHEYYSDETGLPNEKYLRKLLDSQLREEEFRINYIMRVVNRAQVEARIGRQGYIDAVISYTHKVKELLTAQNIFGELDKNTFFISMLTNDILDVNILKVFQKLATHIEINGTFIGLEMKYGSSIYPIDAITPEMILSKTQMALNQAIENLEIQYCPYRLELEQRFKEEQEYQSELSIAVDQDQFVVYYQPQINAITNEIVGVESLLRWFHPTRGLISPEIFIPIAEKYGYIRKLDAFVAKRAIQDYQSLSAIHPNLKISINASTFELINDDYYEMIKDTLNQHFFPKQNLVIELTEGRTVSDITRLIEYTKKLRSLGIQASLDDFGTGFNSISSMIDMELDELKVDRSFIKGYPNHSGSLTKSVIRMADAMKLRVVCEGVETEIQKQFLLENNCIIMQGYLFSKPLPLEGILAYAESFKKAQQR